MPRGRMLLAGALVAAAGPLLAALPTAAAESPPQVVASVKEGGVALALDGSYRHAVLEVSGPGVDFRQGFAAGRNPLIGRFDPDGKPLPDGTYTWRLSLIPDKATARQLRATAKADRGEASTAWSAQTGSFTIARGSFVDPDLVEKSAHRPTAPLDPGKTKSAQAVAAAAGAKSPSTDSDLAVTEGTSEDELPATSSLGEPAAQLHGAEGAEAIRASRRDTDTALLEGAPAEAVGSSKDGAPQKPLQKPVRSDGANGRDRAKRDPR